MADEPRLLFTWKVSKAEFPVDGLSIERPNCKKTSVAAFTWLCSRVIGQVPLPADKNDAPQ